ncbi:MAG: NAD(P)-dependent oxidoreductase [Phycisphaeraceae bacterium]|nr:NAD(P)-dependent oxidoreductase [Phycisphaeraceae bacterium]
MSDEPIRRAGYVGLGIMGSAMAANLLKAGFALTVWNRSASKCELLRQAGAKVAASPAEVASASQVVCINVTDTPDVEAVLFGDKGIATSGATSGGAGLIVIDHSTISPAATREFAARLAKQNVTLIDAPVSGGDVGAKQGTLSIMAGGPQQVFDRCLPLLQAMGKNITLVGDSGAGQLCKACNQIAVSCSLMGVVEAIALARSGGLDVMKMIEVVKAGAGGSWQISNLGPKIAQNDFAPGFMIDLVLKDLAIVADYAAQGGLDLKGVQQALAYFQQAADQGAGRDGTQAMAKVFGGTFH